LKAHPIGSDLVSGVSMRAREIPDRGSSAVSWLFQMPSVLAARYAAKSRDLRQPDIHR